MKTILAILALILASIACGQYAAPVPAVSETVPETQTKAVDTVQPVDTAEPFPTDTASNETAIVRQAIVNGHSQPSGPVTGWVSGGDTVTVLGCKGNWCRIEEPAGYVWRGCLSGNDDIGCEAK